MSFNIFTTTFFFFATCNLSAQIDSVATISTEIKRSQVRYVFLSSLSASYITYKNWQQEDHTSFSFMSNVDFKHRGNYATGWSHDHLIKAELGYLHFVDSIWFKNADQFKVCLQWNEKPGKYLSHSYSVIIQSQFLKSYRYIYNEDDKLEPELKGWFMAPGVIELAYGLNRYFWQKSRVNFAFATCRLISKPRFADNIDERLEEDESLFKSSKRYIKSEYGFSAQLYINKEIYPKTVIWDNQSLFFLMR